MLHRLLFFIFLIGIKALPAQTGWTNRDMFEQKNFIENKGQVEANTLPTKKHVLYTAFVDGASYYFTNSGYFIAHFEKQPKGKEAKVQERKEKEDEEREEKKVHIKPIEKFYELKWEGANPDVQVVAENEVKNYYSYSSRNSVDKNGTIIAHAYTRIIYKELYPYTDVVFEFPKDSTGIKYSIYLHPGADVEKIRMRLPDETVILNEDNNAIITSNIGKITEHAPITYTAENKTPVSSKFKITKNQLGFELANVPDNETIVIDPWVTTPIFGSLSSAAFDIDYDDIGNVYVYGYVYSQAILLKYDATGTVIWSYTSPYDYYGDFAVNRNTGSCYLTMGYAGGFFEAPEMVIKINSDAIVNASFPRGTLYNESWRALFDKNSNRVIIGLGYSSGYQVAYLDSNLTAITNISFDPIDSLSGGDVASLAFDNCGNCYAMPVKGASGAKFDNEIVKMPLPALSPVIYHVPTNYRMYESQVLTSIYYGWGSYNGLTTSNKYVYSFDSYVLKKWDGATGNLLVYKRINYSVYDSITPIHDSSVISWGGISADDCGNLFLADSNVVLQYDNSLNLVNSYTMPGVIMDINYSSGGNLYVCGLGFASSFLPSHVITCTTGPLAITSSSMNATCKDLGSASAIISGGGMPYTVSWNSTPPQYGTNAVDLPPDTYLVTVRDASCIQNELVDTVTVNPPSPLVISAVVINTCKGNPEGAINVTVAGSNGASSHFKWMGFPSDTTSVLDSLIAGTYTVVVTSGYCETTASFTVEDFSDLSSLTRVNVFSPNNDGTNDLFFPFSELLIPGATDNFERYNLQVYDRWGNKIVETTQSEKGWNGTTQKNKNADEGVYYWTVKIKSNCSDKEIVEDGFVQLVR